MFGVCSEQQAFPYTTQNIGVRSRRVTTKGTHMSAVGHGEPKSIIL